MKTKDVIKIVVLALCLVIVCALIVRCSIDYNQQQKEQIKLEQELWGDIVKDNPIPQEWYEQDSYTDITKWWEDIQNLKEEYATYASDIVEEWGNYLTKEQLVQLQDYSEQLRTAHSINSINYIIESMDQITAEAINTKAIADETSQKEAVENNPYIDYSYSYSNNEDNSGYNTDFKSAGVIYQDGWRYTWYSQNVLPGGGLDIPGRHVDSDGFVKDGDGNIVVASDSDAYGSIVNTPFGQGKVYDSGSGEGTRDLYTNY